MKLIVGLGNPGKKYERTRHNLGFLFVDRLAKEYGAEFREKSSLEAEVAEIPEQHLVLAKPLTFMNASGRALQKLLKKYNLQPSDVLVVYDDADLEFCKLRLKNEGSSGGHNGMESILKLYPKNAVARLRIGIGRPQHPDVPLEDFVLSTFTNQEQEEIDACLDQALLLAKEAVEK